MLPDKATLVMNVKEEVHNNTQGMNSVVSSKRKPLPLILIVSYTKHIKCVPIIA